MKLGLQDIDFKMAGALLARASDVEQIEFFKAFTKECSSWGTRLQVEQQFSFINLKLTDDEKNALAMISFIEPISE